MSRRSSNVPTPWEPASSTPKASTSAGEANPSAEQASTSGEHAAAPGPRAITLANRLWWLAMVEVALAVTLLPTTVVFLYLEREASNLLLYALVAIPVGPAVQSGVFALRRGDPAIRDRPWNRYWEGWRLGWRQSLQVWLPAVALGTAAMAGAAYVPADSVARPLAIMGLILAGIALVCAVAALTVIGAFSFRTRDLVRVTLYGMGSRPLGTLGLVAIVFVVGGLVFLAFDAVVMLLACVICYGLLATARPMHRLIRDTLTDQAQ